MCGIYGIARFKDSTFNIKLLRLVLKSLAINSKIRGRDATGYAFSRKDAVNIFKHNVFADQFIKLENYKKVVRENMSNDEYGTPYSIIGHTRQRTKGTPMNPDNNHPIRTGSIVGVHNGMISNDDEIFNWLEKRTEGKLKRIAQVDSEAIFALIDYYSDTLKFPGKYTDKDIIGHADDPTSQAIALAGKRLHGSYACGLIDSDNPTKLWLFRANGQLAVNFYREEGLLIFASVDRFIEDAVKQYQFSDPDSIMVPANSGMCIDTENNCYNIFDLEAPKRQAGFNTYGY